MPSRYSLPLLALALVAGAPSLRAQVDPRPAPSTPIAPDSAPPEARAQDAISSIDGDTVPSVPPLPAVTVPGTAAPARGWQAWPDVRPLYAVGGAEEEALRMAQLRGEAPLPGFLLRSPSSLAPSAPNRRPRGWIIAPEVQYGWNSAIPFGLNDGAMWSGKGSTILLRGGVGFEAGPLRVVFAPEFTHAANAAFDSLIPPAWIPREPHEFLPPWLQGEHSIDLPYRMGTSAVESSRLGQSSVTLTAGPVAMGASSENEWWGPGTRNALLLSNQAAGFNHVFVRTARPLRTPLGWLDARWISGALKDTEWFALERPDESEWRSLSGAGIVLSPGKGFSLGVARTVLTPADDATDALTRGTAVFTRWRKVGDPDDPDRYEQITSVWGRVVVPEQGAEFYVEWARTRLPSNFRALLETPEHTQGYTLGVQWLRPAGPGEIRLQAEHTYLEESPTYAWLTTGSWYASNAIKQGYTHEGQPLGASVGPGASGQWVAVDWLRGRGRGGVFAGRIRWAEDAYYDRPGATPNHLGHDVSLLGGMRGVLPVGPVRLDLEYVLQKRYNYLFQSRAGGFNDRELTENVVNHTLRLGITAAGPRLGRAR